MGVATRQAMEKGPEVVSLGGEVNLNLNSKSITSKLENVCVTSRVRSTPHLPFGEVWLLSKVIMDVS